MRIVKYNTIVLNINLESCYPNTAINADLTTMEKGRQSHRKGTFQILPS